MLGWLLGTRPHRKPKLEERILELLRSHGPLDRSEIQVELLIFNDSDIDQALAKLEQRYLACRRPDPGWENVPPAEQPWGIPLPRHRFASASSPPPAA